MAYLVAFRRERRSEREIWTDHFIVAENVVAENEAPVSSIEKAFRLAVEEYLWTEEANKMLTYTAGDYNWGDAMSSVPDEVFAKHGISVREADKTYSISGDVFEITVNQDEVLSREYHSWPESVLHEILADSNHQSLNSVRATIWSGDIELYVDSEEYVDNGYDVKNTEEYTKTSTGHIAHYLG